MLTRQQSPELLQALSAAFTQAQKGKQETGLENLKQYFQQAQAEREPTLAGQKQAAQNAANMETLKSPEFQDQLNAGGSGKAGDLSIGADPYAHVQQGQMKGEAQAITQAQHVYNSGLPKIQQVAQAASEGLDATNDPQNVGSLGQARTLMLKAMGMNRYNENEAKAVLPPTLVGSVTSLFNQAGNEGSPLNEVQRQNVNQFFKTQLSTAAQQHSVLKQNALQSAMSSPYATPTTAQRLQGLGAPIDQMLSSAQAKYAQVPQTKGPNLTQQPNPTVVDRLKGYFGIGSKPAAPQATPAPQQQQTPPMFDFDAEDKRRAAQKVQQNAQAQQQPPQGQ